MNEFDKIKQEAFTKGWESCKQHLLPVEKSTSILKGIVIGFCSALILQQLMHFIEKFI